MRKSDFTRVINSNDFRELFISYMGWNKPKGKTALLPIIIDEVEYQFNMVAEKAGLQVVATEVDVMPNNSLVRKIDNQLRRQAQDYISIYVHRNNPKHHLWVVPLKNVDKRDLVSLEYIDADHADFLFSKIDEIEFNPSEVVTILDVKDAAHRAFFVNSEKITKDFYAGFKKQHSAFAKFISGIDDEIDFKNNRNKQWYASVMLNRLMFCYFIQKKGFLDGDKDYLRNKLEWCKRERGENRFFKTFYRGFLTLLFTGGLNSPHESDMDFRKKFGLIPYLNGGMFDRHQIERDYADIDIADEAFESLFEFFDRWQWHLDTRVTASGRDINPDVLGYIFEQYINDRAQMGAYYTKEDITEYIGRNTILPFLFDRIAKSSKTVEAMFAPNGWVWQTLKHSGDLYLFDAVKQGWAPDWRNKIPSEIAIGLDTQQPRLLERRARWNDRTPELFALPTEIWRETIERFQRVDDILAKIEGGEITSINDFITYNLDIRLFASDLIAKSDSGSFIYNFYDALRSVTILDPTCGSGAFLFAAMNILEPLYYECIERMRSDFKDNPKVKIALEEISSKYRSNIHYFIYKSIILRNLYGVDIMQEATEIAKLRLFLKMVAVVDVDYRADNLGLDPLPDIDFNIRCGNTLVGYANEKEIEKDLTFASDILQDLANQDFKSQIEEDMQKAAAAFREFRRMQLNQNNDLTEFKKAKTDLANLLANLNNTLSSRLFIATKGDPGELMFRPLFEEWLASHQPFHWVAEFYQIIHGNGGFDVIIGNPPYVEYSKVKKLYQIQGYQTIDCGNIYAQIIERCSNLENEKSLVGWIAPVSSICTDRTETLQRFVGERYYRHISTFDIFPAKIFDGAAQRVAILLLRKGKGLHTTKYYRWQQLERPHLMQSLFYLRHNYDTICWTSRINAELQKDILSKIFEEDLIGPQISNINNEIIYVHRIINNFVKAVAFEPYFKKSDGSVTHSEDFKMLVCSKECYWQMLSVLNSSLFYWFWRIHGDGFHCGFKDIHKFRLNLSSVLENLLKELASSLSQDMETNSIVKTRNQKSTGLIYLQTFYVGKSKPIIDEIDKVLARHYGFTEEELDFIINYDIKYRMGDELNNDSDE